MAWSPHHLPAKTYNRAHATEVAFQDEYLVVCGFPQGLGACQGQSCPCGEGLARGAGIHRPCRNVPHLHPALASAADGMVVDVPGGSRCHFHQPRRSPCDFKIHDTTPRPLPLNTTPMRGIFCPRAAGADMQVTHGITRVQWRPEPTFLSRGCPAPWPPPHPP